MNYLKISVLGAGLSLCLLQAAAQNRSFTFGSSTVAKPKLFTNLPNQLKLQTAGLNNLLTLKIGATAATQLSDHLLLNGIVQSKSEHPNVTTVVVRLLNQQGAILTCTQVHKRDGSIAYVGRIISPQHSDAYEIVQENGTYLLQKKMISEMISE